MIWILWRPCVFAEVPWRSWAWFPDWHGAGDSLTPTAHLVPSALHLAPWQIISSTTCGTCSSITACIFLESLSCLMFFVKNTILPYLPPSQCEKTFSGFVLALTFGEFSRRFSPKYQVTVIHTLIHCWRWLQCKVPTSFPATNVDRARRLGAVNAPTLIAIRQIVVPFFSVINKLTDHQTWSAMLLTWLKKVSRDKQFRNVHSTQKLYGDIFATVFYFFKVPLQKKA